MHYALPVLLLLASSAGAARPKAVVADLHGDRHGAVTKPLRKAICAQFACVSTASIGLPHKIDWKKASHLKVEAVLTGSIGKGKLRLELHTGPGAPTKVWNLPLKHGKLRPADVSHVREQLVHRLEAHAPQEAAPPPAPAPELAPSTPAPPPEPAPAPPQPAPPAASETRPTPPPEQERVERSATDEPLAPPLLHVEIGISLERRTLSYSQLTSANLSEYSAPAIYSPRLRLQVYPLAHGEVARGLGFDLDYRIALGLKSAVAGGIEHPTRMSVFAADLRYRIGFGDREESGVAPFVGYRRAGFRVDPASDGTTFVGLPQIVTGGIRFGAELDYVPTDGLHLLAQADYQIDLAKGDLVGPAYFPNGSASAFEAELGVGYAFSSLIDLRLVGSFTHTGFSFDAASETTYVASGASENLLGGRLMLGFSVD